LAGWLGGAEDRVPGRCYGIACEVENSRSEIDHGASSLKKEAVAFDRANLSATMPKAGSQFEPSVPPFDVPPELDSDPGGGYHANRLFSKRTVKTGLGTRWGPKGLGSAGRFA
jgi:hypothetical protein